eukprot:COSAG02_NODE_1436_length_12609_cov_1282.385292_6_plen_738_part_00
MRGLSLMLVAITLATPASTDFGRADGGKVSLLRSPDDNARLRMPLTEQYMYTGRRLQRPSHPSPPGPATEGGTSTSTWLLIIVLLPFAGRFVVDFLFPTLCAKRDTPEFRSCLDRPFVQLEIRTARSAGKNIITVFEEGQRRPAYFDYSRAWQKYRGGEWSFLLDIDSVTYRRDTEEAEAMIRRILAKTRPQSGGGAITTPEPEPEPEQELELFNEPGKWDFFLSHGQAMAGDQVKVLCQLLRQKGKTVWYDYDMINRDTAAMTEGVRGSENFVLFLSGDGPIDGSPNVPPSTQHTAFCCRRMTRRVVGDLESGLFPGDQLESNRQENPVSTNLSRTNSEAARHFTLIQHLQNTLDLTTGAAEARAESLAAAGFDTPAKFDMLTPTQLQTEYGFRAGDVILLLSASIWESPQASGSFVEAQRESSDLGLTARLNGGDIQLPVLLPGGDTYMLNVNETEPMEQIKAKIHALQTYGMSRDSKSLNQGFTMNDLDTHGSSWAGAVEKNGLSQCDALAQGFVRLLFWHVAQPLGYFYVFHVTSAINYAGYVVWLREAVYLALVVFSTCVKPAFLLVNVRATVQDRETPRVHVRGYGFLAMYVLCPEKFVACALFGTVAMDVGNGLGVLCCAWWFLLDLSGLGAFVYGRTSGNMPPALAVGYLVTSVSVIGMLLLLSANAVKDCHAARWCKRGKWKRKEESIGFCIGVSFLWCLVLGLVKMVSFLASDVAKYNRDGNGSSMS